MPKLKAIVRVRSIASGGIRVVVVYTIGKHVHDTCVLVGIVNETAVFYIFMN